MADDVVEDIEASLNLVVCTTERSGNMKKELKQIIYETVSTLRNLFVKLKSKNEIQSSKIRELEAQANKTTGIQGRTGYREEAVGGYSPATRQVAPSLDQTLQPQTNGARQITTSGGGGKKFFSEVVKNLENDKRYRITVKPKDDSLTPEQIKIQLKETINHTAIKVGIKAVRTIRDRGLLIETGSLEEVTTLSIEITNKLGSSLEIFQHKLRKPRIIIYNVPEDITTEILGTTIRTQNPELQIEEDNITPKFRYKNRRGKHNIVMAVSPQARKQILQTKLKLEWEICSTADYIVPTRCYKCNRYNHKHYECRGKEACPHCNGNHKMKDCTVAASEMKCINCITYKKFNKEGKVAENHSALSKECSSLHPMIKIYRNNIEY